MGRRKKFKPGDVAWFEKEAEIVGGSEMGDTAYVKQYCVIVDYYRTEGQGKAGYYIVVPTTGPDIQMNVTGPATWVKSWQLHPTPDSYRMKTILSRYRNNQTIPDRGCSCNCCIHTSVPPSMVDDKGQYRWDFDEGDTDGQISDDGDSSGDAEDDVPGLSDRGDTRVGVAADQG